MVIWANEISDSLVDRRANVLPTPEASGVDLSLIAACADLLYMPFVIKGEPDAGNPIVLFDEGEGCVLPTLRLNEIY